MPVAGLSPRQEHGDVFAPDMGAMIVHIQRETGLAHRTYVLRAWQVRAMRMATNRWAWFAAGVALVSWVFFAAQAVRVPLLTNRISSMERDAARIDTLEATLRELQSRYEQVQSMLSRAPAQGAAPAGGSRP
jgi:hypothetical protein